MVSVVVTGLILMDLCSLPRSLRPSMLSLFCVSQFLLGSNLCCGFLIRLFHRGGHLFRRGAPLIRRGVLLLCLLHRGGLLPCLLRTGGLLPCLLRRGGLLPCLLRTGGLLPCLLRRGGLLPCLLRTGGLLLCRGGLLPCLLRTGGLLLRRGGRLSGSGGLLSRSGGLLLRRGGLLLRLVVICSAVVVRFASMPSLSISTWTWPSVPPPVPPPLHRPPGLYRSVWKTLLVGGHCHKSVPWTSVHSPPEVTHSPHGLLHYTAYPIIHCTDDTHTADYTNHAHTWELSHNHYHPITHSL